MIFEDLKKGTIFFIDGAPYEADIIGDRVVVAFILEDVSSLHGQTVLSRKYDPNDPIGDAYLTTAFSDLRFNRNNETQEDRDARDVI